MEESQIVCGVGTAMMDRAVLIEPISMHGLAQVVVCEHIWGHVGRFIETEIQFASLGEALAYGNCLFRDRP